MCVSVGMCIRSSVCSFVSLSVYLYIIKIFDNIQLILFVLENVCRLCLANSSQRVTLPHPTASRLRLSASLRTAPSGRQNPSQGTPSTPYGMRRLHSRSTTKRLHSYVLASSTAAVTQRHRDRFHSSVLERVSYRTIICWTQWSLKADQIFTIKMLTLKKTLHKFDMTPATWDSLDYKGPISWSC